MGFTERRGNVLIKCELCGEFKVFGKGDGIPYGNGIKERELDPTDPSIPKEKWIWAKVWTNNGRILRKNVGACPDHVEEVLFATVTHGSKSEPHPMTFYFKGEKHGK